MMVPDIMEVSDIIDALDERQKEAVLSDARSLLIVAGPGSGKTRVLASRFARLLAEGGGEGGAEGAGVDGLLAVTFTNRAASEMKQRVATLTSVQPDRLNVSTLHAFCLKFLKDTQPAFTLYGRGEQIKLLKGLGAKNPERAADEISAFKNFFNYGVSTGEAPPGFTLYEDTLRELGALDLDDLITASIRAIEDGCRAPDFSHVLVDEYQDINPAQARLIGLLAGGGRGGGWGGGGETSLAAIGDPDQAIYAFRGASLKAFLDFETDRPDAQVIRLERNYRSKARIAEASASVIANNTERLVNTTCPVREGGEVRLVNCPDERAEADFIIDEIEARMGGLSSLTVGADTSGIRFSDFAVLTRTNRQAEVLAEAFKNSSIPFQAIRPPGPDFTEFLRHLKSMDPGAGTSLEDLIRSVAVELKAGTEITYLFMRTAAPFKALDAAESKSTFVEEMLLRGPADNVELEADKVKIMTIHTSKGLEFGTVFLTGVEDGLLPLKIAGSIDMEEERRLFYVGMTRARDNAYLISASKRRIWGTVQSQSPSPFIAEIPDGLIRQTEIKKKKKIRRAVQSTLFE